jgi:hypothetical protein
MDTPHLSTMVVLYKTNLQFDTNSLLHALPLNDEIIKIEKRGVLRRGASKRDSIKRRSKKEPTTHTSTGFCHNSMTIVMMSSGDGSLHRKEITVKIFQNGVFHMTGVLHELYDTCVMKSLLTTLWNDCRASIRDCPEFYEILNRRVVLMNYTTRIQTHKTIARELLHTTIRSVGEGFQSHYDPDVYPGVKIQIEGKKWTAKIFRTGKVILTGITSHEDSEEFMKQLLCLFEKVLPKTPARDSMSNTAVLSSGR